MQAKCQEKQRELNGLQQRLSIVQQKQDRVRAELAHVWATHPACEDDSALAALRYEKASLSLAEDREESLKEARRSADQLAGAIKTLEEQLSEIPPEYRRPASDVATEKQQVEQQQQLVDEQLRIARDRLTEIQRQQSEFEKQRKMRDAAAGEFALYKKLAEKLGKQGLLPQIIQQAQEQIATNANGILSRLSNGLWQVDLENKNESELHIQARDLMTGQNRPFKCLSGGEKFRIAICLAVAIGQYVLGGRSVDTLIIDEGFGALDETNRDLLVKELSNLSEEALRGGRVIVVSHQEDVCDRFGSSYRIEKEADGYIKCTIRAHGIKVCICPSPLMRHILSKGDGMITDNQGVKQAAAWEFFGELRELVGLHLGLQEAEWRHRLLKLSDVNTFEVFQNADIRRHVFDNWFHRGLVQRRFATQLDQIQKTSPELKAVIARVSENLCTQNF